jgi:hypothetical protein
MELVTDIVQFTLPFFSLDLYIFEYWQLSLLFLFFNSEGAREIKGVKSSIESLFDRFSRRRALALLK